jgi:hypothetical protein
MIDRVEQIQKLIIKLEQGQDLVREEMTYGLAVKPEHVLGYTEENRLRSKFE